MRVESGGFVANGKVGSAPTADPYSALLPILFHRGNRSDEDGDEHEHEDRDKNEDKNEYEDED